MLFEGLNALDFYIRLGCTKLAHWVQRTTGYTNYTLAALGAVIVGITQVVHIMNYLFPQLVPTHPESLLLIVFCLLILWLVSSRIPLCFENEDRVYAGKLPKQIQMQNTPMWRLFWVYFVLLDTAFSVMDGLNTVGWIRQGGLSYGEFICMYMLTVVPLPPGTNRISEFCKSLSAGASKPVADSN